MPEYNRQNAISYANLWWNKRNPKFYNFDGIGGDCTNFISQCLFAGGFEMNQNWHYYSLNNRSPSWTGVEELYRYLVTHKKATETTISELKIGDIVQICQNGDNFHHTMIIVNIIGNNSPENILIACHTRDAINKRLSDYKFKKIRFLKIN